MNVSVEEAGPCRKILTIEIPAEEVAKEYKEVLSVFLKKANIPGFRAGKAPAKLVESRFKADIIEQVRDTIVPKSYHEAIQQEKIAVVAILDMDEVDVVSGEPLSYKVTLDVQPDFELPVYEGIKLTRNPVEVSDEDVDGQIAQILQQQARYEDVEGRVVAAGDLAQIDFTGTCDGQSLEEIDEKAAGIGKGEDFWVRVDENAFIPEFAEGLPGTEIGGETEITATFPADFGVEALAGKDVLYKVSVKALREQILPEIDEEFCKKIGEENEESLRNSVRGEIAKQGEQQEESRLRAELRKHLLDSVTLELPESVVQEETRRHISDFVRQGSERGMSEDQITENKDKIYESATATAQESVKGRYVMLKIAAAENIEVSDKELDAEITTMGYMYQMGPDELRKRLTENNSMDDLRHDIQIRKTLDLLMEKAEISSK